MRIKLQYFVIPVFVCLLTIWITGCRSGESSNAKFEPPTSSYQEKFFGYSDSAIEMRVKGATVTPDFFGSTGGAPQLGRFLIKPDFNREGGRVVVISRGLWISHLKSDPAIIGKSISIDGADYTVVGVLPSSINIPTGAEIWIPKY